MNRQKMGGTIVDARIGTVLGPSNGSWTLQSMLDLLRPSSGTAIRFYDFDNVSFLPIFRFAVAVLGPPKCDGNKVLVSQDIYLDALTDSEIEQLWQGGNGFQIEFGTFVYVWFEPGVGFEIEAYILGEAWVRRFLRADWGRRAYEHGLRFSMSYEHEDAALPVYAWSFAPLAWSPDADRRQ